MRRGGEHSILSPFSSGDSEIPKVHKRGQASLAKTPGDLNLTDPKEKTLHGNPGQDCVHKGEEGGSGNSHMWAGHHNIHIMPRT